MSRNTSVIFSPTANVALSPSSRQPRLVCRSPVRSAFTVGVLVAPDGGVRVAVGVRVTYGVTVAGGEPLTVNVHGLLLADALPATARRISCSSPAGGNARREGEPLVRRHGPEGQDDESPIGGVVENRSRRMRGASAADAETHVDPLAGGKHWILTRLATPFVGLHDRCQHRRCCLRRRPRTRR